MVPVAVLRAEPYNLDWGDSVWIKVRANNDIGIGPYSSEGNGALMLTNPDKPLNFKNNPEITNAN